jgi:carboxymethylenebutenolidase
MPDTIQITRPDGKTVPAVELLPTKPQGAAGVVLIQEWWGINDQIQRTGRRLAETGYRVLIPNLYRGNAALDTAEAQHKMDNLDFADAANQDIRGAVQYLKKNTQRVGVLGFCMGGVLAVLAAMHVREADAAVSWYGIPPAEAGDPAAIKIPLQCHFALRDQFFPISAADALEQKLAAGHVVHECYRYDAKHAFFNEDWDFYDAQCAKLAWQRSTDFLQKHLRG